MTIKGKHHYVPRLYLKQFASKPRRINVCVLQSGSFRNDISLKDQCQRPRFYGRTNEVENELMQLESLFGPTLDGIVRASTLPKVGSPDHTNLLLFCAFQAARTPLTIGGVTEGFEKLYANVTARGADHVNDFERIKMQHDEAVLQSLKNAGFVAHYWADLQTHLLLDRSGTLFTSDNPVVLYNQYCEGLKGMGTTGAIKRGLQVFVPVSPCHLIMLYDKLVYKVGAKNTDVTEICDPDVRTLNLLQIANADKILLFSKWTKVAAMKTLINKGVKLRRTEISHLEEFLAEDDPEHDSLLQIYPVPLNVKLNLSFLNLRRKAQAVPLRQRALQYRVNLRPDEFDQIRPAGKRVQKRFVRKDAP